MYLKIYVVVNQFWVGVKAYFAFILQHCQYCDNHCFGADFSYWFEKSVQLQALGYKKYKSWKINKKKMVFGWTLKSGMKQKCL